jgi:hypothetical protein
VISNACPQYRDPTNTAIINFRSIINPYYKVDTDPIEIVIKDKGLRVVCELKDNGPIVSTTVGDLKANSLTSDDTKEVSSVTSVVFSIKPNHNLQPRA